MNAVLIVGEMLNDFFERSPILAMQRSRLVAGTNLLARTFRSEGLPVVWVRQEFAPDLHDAFRFADGKRVHGVGSNAAPAVSLNTEDIETLANYFAELK